MLSPELKHTYSIFLKLWSKEGMVFFHKCTSIFLRSYTCLIAPLHSIFSEITKPYSSYSMCYWFPRCLVQDNHTTWQQLAISDIRSVLFTWESRPIRSVAWKVRILFYAVFPYSDKHLLSKSKYPFPMDYWH